jgi:hypothetical protein
MNNEEKVVVAKCTPNCKHDWETLTYSEHMASVKSAIKKVSKGEFRRAPSKKWKLGRMVSNRHSQPAIAYKTMLKVLKTLEHNYGPFEPERCSGMPRDYWHDAHTPRDCCHCHECAVAKKLVQHG